MAYIITGDCILCDACIPECPEDAIIVGDPKYIIKAELCTDCGDCADKNAHGQPAKSCRYLCYRLAEVIGHRGGDNAHRGEHARHYKVGEET